MRRVFTYEEFVKYRNKVFQRAKARRETFPNDPPNYWEIRLHEINTLYPEWAAIGKVYEKKPEQVSG